ncbi:hypothetical protein AB0P36_32370 [Streptomyces flavidovirens]|uniref:hypothetical protein n=1 Tax=Streptomyces flavidovirens TaxID=67298 RepID=UPI00343C9F73
MVYLFFPETDTGRAAGYAHLARVSTRLAAGGPGVSEAAGQGQIAAIGKNASVPFEQVRADLEAIKQPVLYATGIQDAISRTEVFSSVAVPGGLLRPFPSSAMRGFVRCEDWRAFRAAWRGAAATMAARGVKWCHRCRIDSAGPREARRLRA